MNSLQATIIIVLLEVTVALLVAAGAVVVRYLRQQARDRRGREALILKLKAEREERLAGLKQLLGETLRCDAERVETAARELIQAETTLYRELLELYTHRAGEALGELDQKVRTLLQPYCELLRQAAAHADDAGTGDAPAALQTRVVELENQNRRLTAELEAAKKEMSSTLNEYASAFGGGHEGAEHVLEDPDHGTTGAAPGVADRAPAAAPPPPPQTASTAPPAEVSEPDGIDSILKDLDLGALDLKLGDEAAGEQPPAHLNKAAGTK